jgi:hypothetical protein
MPKATFAESVRMPTMATQACLSFAAPPASAPVKLPFVAGSTDATCMYTRLLLTFATGVPPAQAKRVGFAMVV